jgi:pantetheine-phosphate adenylyltransferase
MKSCIYAGSFDCFHNGHANIVNRALKAFDHVYILVANNPNKKYLFNIDERIKIIHKMFANNDSVSVHILPDTSLVSDFAREHGITSVLKGIRNIQDTEYEKMLHEVTVSQENGIDTFVLFSDPKDQKISSSAVKELIKYNADVRDYVPLYTKQMLEIRQNKQYIVGLTGGIGCGKSYIANLLSKFGVSSGVPVTNVDFDVISNEITYSDKYSWQNNHEVMELRSTVQKMLMGNDADQFPSIVKSRLAERVFNDPKFNATLLELYKPVMIREMRKKIAGKSGLILLNGALLVDGDMTYLCNNNVIIVDSSKETVLARLKSRGYSPEESVKRINSQMSNDARKAFMILAMVKDNNGALHVINNDVGDPVHDSPTDEAKSIELNEKLKDSFLFKSIFV